jgi:DNA-binding CsgD family transcriptional regulator/pimeloyl-ACP methyl ester carboxylesterase
MDVPAVRYVTTGDGYSIAYAVSGDGRPIVLMPQPISHIQVYWTHDTWVRPWLRGLAGRFQLIQYDGRGQGLSTRGLRPDFSMQDAVTDLEAVVDELALKRFVLMAVQPFGHTAVRYAVDHPDRLEALVLVSSAISLETWSIAILAQFGDGDWDALLRSQAGLSQAADINASVERQKLSINQQDYQLLVGAAASSSIADLLPRVDTPALVLHPRQSMNLQPAESMRLAAAIRGARLVLIDGATPLGDAGQGMEAIERFLEDLPGLDEQQEAPDVPLSALSPREVEVLRLVAHGRSNPQIANELVISLNTVQRHVSNILAKTGLDNRTQAASYAHRQKLT